MALLGAAVALADAEPSTDYEKVAIVGTLLMPFNGRPYIGVIVDNPAATAIWTSVALGGTQPTRCGSGNTRLDAGQRLTVACGVSEVVAKVEYPVTLEIYADEAQQDHVGTRQARARFRGKDVAWLKTHLEPPAKP